MARCLSAIADHAQRINASVHMPWIGGGIAGGRWERIDPIITEALSAHDMATAMYDFD